MSRGKNVDLELEQLAEHDEVLSNITRAVFNTMNRKTPQTEEELITSINDFWINCIDNNLRPSIELLCSWLGVHRTTFWRWCNDYRTHSSEWQDICRRTHQGIVACLEQLGNTGKLNPVTYIFSMKNIAGYSDQTTTVIEDNSKRMTVRDLPIFGNTVDLETINLRDDDKPKKTEVSSLPIFGKTDNDK